MGINVKKIIPRIPPLPSIRDIINMYNIKALRQLSQNFLLDRNLNDKIVKCCGKINGYEICEIGPGPGNISRSLLKKGIEKLILIEKDTRFLPSLQMLKEAVPTPIEIISGDVLSFDMSNLFNENERKSWDDDYPKIQLIGNLPFNISTPLIIKWMQAISEQKSAWSYGRVKMTLTFQKEVAERIEAPVMSAQRCRLSIMCQNWCEVQHRFNIPGRAFVPKPKVDVGVVHFKPYKTPIIPLPFQLVEKVATAIFRYRQKFVRKGLETLFPDHCSEKLVTEILQKSEIPQENRSFQLSLSEIGRICCAYKNIIEKSPALYKFKYNSEDRNWEENERNSDIIDQNLKNNIIYSNF